jgi:predicted dehydrogenase
MGKLPPIAHLPGDHAVQPANATRRDFLKTSTVATAAAGASLLELAPPVHAAAGGTLRVGLVGCGGRGTGAAEQACNAGPDIKLTAMGDAFRDHLDAKKKFLKDSLGSKFAVKDENCFVGFDAYKGVIENCDVVLLTAPPHFRPLHLEAAVAAGKHTFCEKPVAVDSPGLRRVMAACEAARAKRLAIVSGLCWRYHDGMRETFKRIHDGAVGDIVALQCTYNHGMLWHKPRQPEWSDMEWQLRNWLYFNWLSGDHIVEQAIHSLDKMAWAMKDEYPVKAMGMGGRQVRTGPEFGHIFDHHAVVYEFASGLKCFHMCRQQPNVHNEVTDYIMGTKGVAEPMPHKITGANPWQYDRKKLKQIDMYQTEHNELFASIRSGTPINNGDYMCKSTLMAIMGRMATYTGQIITWDKALASSEDLTPGKYEWGPLPVPPVAKPGSTRFV